MILNPKQKQSIRDSDARLNIWEGSVRSGKSVGIDFRILKAFGEEKRDLPPDAIDVMVGKTLSALKRNVINPLIELVGSENAQYYSGKQELHLWGNVVHTIGANDERSEGKIRGSTVRKCLGDELTLWPESFFKMLDTRLSLEKSQFFGSTNPGHPTHYLKKEYIDRAGEINLKSFKFRLDDNLALIKSSPTYIESIKKNFTGFWYKRFILGEWVLAEGAIHDFFDEEQHTVIDLPKECVAQEYVVGIDYGTADPCVFGMFGVNHNTKPKIWLEKEYFYDGRAKNNMHQKTDAEYSKDLAAFITGYNVTQIVVPTDATSFKVQLIRDGFSHIMMDADMSPGSVLDGIRVHSAMLKNGQYTIKRCCKNTIGDYGGYVWDDKALIRGVERPLHTASHTKDMERYVLFTLFGENYINYDAFMAD